MNLHVFMKWGPVLFIIVLPMQALNVEAMRIITGWSEGVLPKGTRSTTKEFVTFIEGWINFTQEKCLIIGVRNKC